jgi:hypothetical protein
MLFGIPFSQQNYFASDKILSDFHLMEHWTVMLLHRDTIHAAYCTSYVNHTHISSYVKTNYFRNFVSGVHISTRLPREQENYYSI